MSSIYEFIETEKANYRITKMCLWSGVSKSGFYEWRSKPTSATAERRAALTVKVIEIFNTDGSYGYRRIQKELANDGVVAGPELVRSIMRAEGLVACNPKPFRVTTIQDGDVGGPEDLVLRDFTADAPGTKLVGDITYIRTWAGWVYLATVIDCYSRMVVGYALADHMRTTLIIDAIDMARRNGGIVDDCIFHSDRGSQYTSSDFQKHLNACVMRGSMGRTGVCWDNAMAESFFATLKNELVYRTVYPTQKKAIDSITNWIEIRYNRKRLHSAIGYRTPMETHMSYNSSTQAA